MWEFIRSPREQRRIAAVFGCAILLILYGGSWIIGQINTKVIAPLATPLIFGPSPSEPSRLSHWNDVSYMFVMEHQFELIGILLSLLMIYSLWTVACNFCARKKSGQHTVRLVDSNAILLGLFGSILSGSLLLAWVAPMA